MPSYGSGKNFGNQLALKQCKIFVNALRKPTSYSSSITKKELDRQTSRKFVSTNHLPALQAGYKFLGGNRLKIGSRVYQYWNSREIEGRVKTLTIKRTTLGELFMIVVVDNIVELEVKSETSRIAGFDFGLKVFLTVSDGTQIESPQFLKQSLTVIKKASRQHSKKVKGSTNRERARKNLVRRHEDVVNRRSDWLWKLAHDLTDRFDVLCFETLNLKGMQRLWGRKISDLAFGEFLQILEWVAKKKDKQIVFIDRWYPSSETCSNCGHVLKELDLSIREWRCPSCQSVNGRDQNAAKNICVVGASTARVRRC